MRTHRYHITHLKKNVVAAALILCLLWSGNGVHGQTASKEYKVKAVFLFNFTQFVEWPGTAFSSAGAPFVVGVAGEDPFGPFLEETVQNERVGSHPVVVQRYHEAKDVRGCHILFLNYKDPEKLKEALLQAGRNTLTVSDADGFMRMGGMIRFVTENNKIRLQVCPDAAKSAELQISSKLLRVAEIYDPKLQR